MATIQSRKDVTTSWDVAAVGPCAIGIQLRGKNPVQLFIGNSPPTGSEGELELRTGDATSFGWELALDENLYVRTPYATSSIVMVSR